MDKNRYSEWIDASLSFISLEMFLYYRVQGLGIIDVELVEEFPNLQLKSQLEQDKLKKLRHIIISELWILGAYELIRFIDEKCKRRNKNGNYTVEIKEDTKTKLKNVFGLFNQLRTPLAKLERPSSSEHILYSQIADSFWNENKGVGWKIYSTNPKDRLEMGTFYRKDLADSLLELLKQLKEDILLINKKD